MKALTYSFLSVILIAGVSFLAISKEPEAPAPENYPPIVGNESRLAMASIQPRLNLSQAYQAEFNANFEIASEYFLISLKRAIIMGEDIELVASLSGVLKLFATSRDSEKIDSLRKQISLESSISIPLRSILNHLFKSGYARMDLSNGKYHEAELLINDCLDFFAPHRHIYPEIYGDLLHLKGLNLHEQNLLEQALGYYNLALEFRRGNDSIDHVKRAATLNNIGNVYWKYGDYKRALSFHQMSLEYKRAHLSEQHPDIATSHNNIGVLLNDLGQHNQALKYHQIALEHRRQTLGSHISVAHSLHNIGKSFFFLDQVEEALESLEEALEIKLLLLGEEHSTYINSLSFLANIYSHNGNFKRSDSLLNKAMFLCSNSISDPCSYINHLIPTNLVRKGFITKAISFENESNKNNSLSNDIIDIERGKQLREFAEALSRVGDDSLAIVYADRSIFASTGVLRGKLDNSFFREHRFFNLSDVLSALGLISDSFAALAQQHHNSSFLISANEADEVALLVLDESMSNPYAEITGGTIEQESTTVTQRSLNNLIVLYRYTQEDIYLFRALEIANYSSNWLLQTQLNELDAMNKAGAPIETIEDAKSIIFKLVDSKRKEYSWHELSDSTHQYKTDQFHWRQELAVLKSKLSNTYPLYRDFRSSRTSYYTNSTIDYLTLNKANLLQYFSSNDSLYVLIVGNKSVALENLGLESEIKEQVDALLNAMNPSLATDFVVPSETIYRRLFFPLQPHLTESRIVVIPNKTTQTISFESLISDKESIQGPYTYLISDYSFSYSYSASSFTDQASVVSRQYEKDILAIAPVFDSKHTPSASTLRFLSSFYDNEGSMGNSVEPLAGTIDEVSMLKSLFGEKKSNRTISGESNFWLRDSVSEFDFKNQSLDDYRILHIATHSFSSIKTPLKSGILLNVSESHPEDGILYASEIFSLNLNPELVVLSSCDTARGSNKAQSSLSGFIHGFLFAGAKNIIASIWPSDDVGSRVFMQHFYSNYYPSANIPVSIRKAKLDLLNDPGPISHPYYWSGFIHIGPPA